MTKLVRLVTQPGSGYVVVFGFGHLVTQLGYGFVVVFGFGFLVVRLGCQDWLVGVCYQKVD